MRGINQNKIRSKFIYQIKSFPVRVHGVIIKMCLGGILDITCNTPVISAKFRTINVAV